MRFIACLVHGGGTNIYTGKWYVTCSIAGCHYPKKIDNASPSLLWSLSFVCCPTTSIQISSMFPYLVENPPNI